MSVAHLLQPRIYTRDDLRVVDCAGCGRTCIGDSDLARQIVRSVYPQTHETRRRIVARVEGRPYCGERVEESRRE